MTPEQCRELASLFEARAKGLLHATKLLDGPAKTLAERLIGLDRETARYLREKAGE